MRVALAFLGVLGGPGLILRPQTAQLATPDPVFLDLSGEFLQAHFNGLEVARQLLEPDCRGFPDKARIHQIAELLLDVIQGNRLSQVDLALEALLQPVPQLENIQRQPGQLFGMLGPGPALALGKRSQARAIARQYGFAFKDAAIEAGQQNVFHETLDPAQFAIQQSQFGQPRQLGAQEFGRLGQLLHQQPLKRPSMLIFSLGRRRETTFLDGVALFYQCRINRHRQPGNLLLGFFSHRGKHFGLDRLLVFRCLRHRQRGLTGLRKAGCQLGQIAAFAEELAFAIHNFKVHLQVVFHLLRRFSPRLVAHPCPGHAQQLTAQRLGQRAFGEGHALQGGLDEVRYRNKIFP